MSTFESPTTIPLQPPTINVHAASPTGNVSPQKKSLPSTRIASSDAVMWRDIALANRDALGDAIDMFTRHLATLRDAI